MERELRSACFNRKHRIPGIFDEGQHRESGTSGIGNDWKADDGFRRRSTDDRWIPIILDVATTINFWLGTLFILLLSLPLRFLPSFYCSLSGTSVCFPVTCVASRCFFTQRLVLAMCRPATFRSFPLGVSRPIIHCFVRILTYINCAVTWKIISEVCRTFKHIFNHLFWLDKVIQSCNAHCICRRPFCVHYLLGRQPDEIFACHLFAHNNIIDPYIIYFLDN